MRIFLPLTLLVVGVTACSSQAAMPSSRGIAATLLSHSGQPADLKNRRLFVSDAGNGNIYLYDVPSLKLVTILQGFTSPQGECADDNGNVWVTDNRADEIYQLSYAGRALGNISDTTGYPVSCAWDPTTRNLAVTNFLGVKSQSGGVLVYAKGTGTAATYTNPAQLYYDFAGYDETGNLFFDGGSALGKFMLSELPYKAQTANTIKISGATIYSAGMVEWDPIAKYLDVGDQNCDKAATSCIYQLQLSGKAATVVDKISLQGSGGAEVCDIAEGVVADGRLFASDNDYCGYASSATYGWHYPAGGSPAESQGKYASEPIGAALAVKPKTGAIPRPGGPRKDLDVKKLDLLYVSQADGDVSVYTYWQKTLVRELTGFSSPQGECVDKKNNVYITDAGNDDIVEYAHDGTRPLRTIDDSPNSPYACAVDSTTGNLAVANKSSGSGNGNVAIYAKATGAPTILSDSAIPAFAACVYDNQGNLVAANSSRYTGDDRYFAWLPAGGTKLVNITVPGPFRSYYWEGVQGLQWDGRYFVIDIYDSLVRVAIQNGQAYYVGATSLDEENDASGPGWIYNTSGKKQGTQYVGLYIVPDDQQYDGVIYSDYPQSGNFNFLNGIASPRAVAVSLGKLHE